METAIAGSIAHGAGDLTIMEQKVGNHDAFGYVDPSLSHGLGQEFLDVSSVKVKGVSAGMELILEAKLPWQGRVIIPDSCSESLEIDNAGQTGLSDITDDLSVDESFRNVFNVIGD